MLRDEHGKVMNALIDVIPSAPLDSIVRCSASSLLRLLRFGVRVFDLGRQRGMFAADRLRDSVAELSVILYYLSENGGLTQHDVSYCLAMIVAILKGSACCLGCHRTVQTWSCDVDCWNWMLEWPGRSVAGFQTRACRCVSWPWRLSWVS